MGGKLCSRCKNIKGHCQQTFDDKKFVDITQQYFASFPQINIPTNNLNFYRRWRWWDWIQATFLIFFYFTSVVEGHFGHAPSWQISWHVWFAPTGPQTKVFPQISPQLGILSVQIFRKFSSRGFLPQKHVLINSGLLGQISQFSFWGSWHILRHVWLPQARGNWHIFPQE